MADALSASNTHACNGVPTFASTAASYLQHGGERRYLPPIVEYFGETPVAAITPFDVKQMALQLYPTQSNTTRNRAALTPARAVMIHGYERGWCPLMRLTRFRQEPTRRRVPASVAWLQIFVRQCDLDGLPHLAALIIFMSQSGARISEAVRLCWSEVDIIGRRVVLLRTKTSTNSPRALTDALVGRLRQLAVGAAPDDRVFRYRCRFSVNERIAAVCSRAGIAYKSTHLCGRHAFATNALAMGSDVKSAMEAGNWKSSAIFIETYVHAPNAARQVADRFNGIEFGAI